MKKKVLLLVGALLLALNGCGSADGGGSAKIEGALEGNTYTMAGIGMAVAVPENFTVLTGKELDSGTYGADASMFYRFVAQDETQKHMLTCFIVPQEKLDATGYLETLRQQMEQQEIRDEIGEIQTREIAGFSFQTMDARVTMDGVPMRESCLVHAAGGWLVCLDYSYPDADTDKARAALDNMILNLTQADGENTAAE